MLKASTKKRLVVAILGVTAVLALVGGISASSVSNNCNSLPSHAQLQAALVAAVAAESSGFNLQMWATIVGRDGTVCEVAFSGAGSGDQWLGSRVISAQKANTANAFSLSGLALATANLYSAVQPGGSLFGLQESNPVDTNTAYGGNSLNFGQLNDPMKGKKIGGINVFGGGLGLYAAPSGSKTLVGGIGVSGDTSCADHMIAWRTRKNLNLDFLTSVNGVSGDATRPDNIVYDIGPAGSAGGFGHPTCVNTGNQLALPTVQ